MTSTLRDLLIQRAASLQAAPALSTPSWGALSYAQLRNRAEGVALGLLTAAPPTTIHSATGTAWDWAAELAAAASGLIWDPAGPKVPSEILGGPSFNADAGRGPYHAREQVVVDTLAFSAGLSHGEILLRLRRLNLRLDWDHTTRVELPLAQLASPALRAALWSALYAGAHVVLIDHPASAPGLLTRFRKAPPSWDEAPFLELWNPPSETTG